MADVKAERKITALLPEDLLERALKNAVRTIL